MAQMVKFEPQHPWKPIRLVVHTYSAGEVELGNSRDLPANQPSPRMTSSRSQCETLSQNTTWTLSSSSGVEGTTLWFPCAHIQNPNAFNNDLG